MYGGLALGWGALGWGVLLEDALPVETPAAPGYSDATDGRATSASATSGRAYGARTEDP